MNTIKDNPHLIKDISTGSIINTDTNGYNSAILRKKHRKEINALIETVNALARRVEELEKRIGDK